ncbi:MAG: efflux RND transporter periplasmic adaptor subunit [Terrimicrobiaceae bacterium]
MNRSLACIAGLLLVGLASCGKKASAPPPPPPRVTVTPVIQQDVLVTRNWVGLLNGYQNADIKAQVTGYLMTQDYKEGSLVKKGEVLFTIDKRPFQAALAQAQADYAKAVANAQLAEITLDRQTQLYRTKVISQQEYDTSYQNTQASIASVAAQQANVQTAQINLNYCTITAPFDGIAGVAQAQIGDLVGPGGTASVLTQMSQVNPIKVNFSITEEEYLGAAALLKRLQQTTQQDLPERLELTLADGTVYSKKGRFDFVNRQVNVATGTIQITALFPNDEDVLRPGLFARVTAPVEELKGALVVPQAATVELQGNYLVILLGPDNVVQPTPIKLGPTKGEMQVIMGPVKAGDKVVVGGVEKMRPGMKVDPQPFQPPTPHVQAEPAAGSEASPSPAPSPAPSPEATKTGAAAGAVVPTATGPWHNGLPT